MKIINIVYSFIAIAILTACSTSDFRENATEPDEAKDSRLISFAASEAKKSISRASAGYRDWNPTTDFQTMGVFGWYDTFANTIFSNTLNKYNYSDNPRKGSWTSPETTWTYTQPKYWIDYIEHNSFDFFATMPYNEGATMSDLGENAYKLSVPIELKEVIDEVSVTCPITTEETAYISQPKHLNSAGYEPGKTTIPLQFDQTLAGLKLEFQLGTKMGEIRQFRVKSVKINVGKVGIPYKGNATRTYTWTGSSWNAGNIVWEIAEADKFTSIQGSLAELDIPGAPAEAIVVTSDEPKVWGVPFYCIPATGLFNPTLTLTYDVEVLDETGTAWVTRQDVTSSIDINSTNFPQYNSTNVKAGAITTLHINIVPDYLYVLSDFDHTNGILIVETN